MKRSLHLVAPLKVGHTEADAVASRWWWETDAPSTAPGSTGEFLEAWLAGRQALRPSTMASYRFHLHRYLLPAIGAVALSALRPEHIEAMYAGILAANRGRVRPVSASTLHRVHATLMSALNHAVRRGLLQRNPAETVEPPRPVFPTNRVWTGAQLGEFLQQVEGDPMHQLFLTLGLLGLRRGKALGLRWSDVDFDAGRLHVRRQVVGVEGRVWEGPPKSSAGHRSVAMPQRLDAALRWYQCDQQLHWPQAVIIDPERPLFSGPDGVPFSPASVSRHFDRLVAVSGLPRIRLHDLRHTSASIGLASGETLLEVSRRLGHSSITITGDVYSHVAPATARASAERLAATVRPGPSGPRS